MNSDLSRNDVITRVFLCKRRGSGSNCVNSVDEGGDSVYFGNYVSVLNNMYLSDNFKSDKKDNEVFLQNINNCNDVHIDNAFKECAKFKLNKRISYEGKRFDIGNENYPDTNNYGDIDAKNGNLDYARKIKTNGFKYMEYRLKNDCNMVYEYQEGTVNRAKQLAAFQRLYCVDFDQN